MSGWRHKTRGPAIADWPSFHDRPPLAMGMSSGPKKRRLPSKRRIIRRWHPLSRARSPINNGDEVRLKRGGPPIRSCETDLEVTPPCELSSPSLARCVTFSELPPQFFSVRLPGLAEKTRRSAKQLPAPPRYSPLDP